MIFKSMVPLYVFEFFCYDSNEVRHAAGAPPPPDFGPLPFCELHLLAVEGVLRIVIQSRVSRGIRVIDSGAISINISCICWQDRGSSLPILCIGFVLGVFGCVQVMVCWRQRFGNRLAIYFVVLQP